MLSQRGLANGYGGIKYAAKLAIAMIKYGWEL